MANATSVTRERWERIYCDSFPRVYRALLASLFDRDLALDSLHEAFLLGLEHPPLDVNPEGWLFRVAVRSAGHSRRRWPRLRLFDRSSDGELRRAMERLEVGELLAALTERQRTITVAHYYLGMTQEEIADALDIKRGTVGATISQALARMREEAADAS